MECLWFRKRAGDRMESVLSRSIFQQENHNLGVSGRCSNQLSYLAMAHFYF